MQSIENQSAFLENEISKLNFPVQPSNLYDPLRYFMKLGGKRMRPMLTLMGCDLFGKESTDALHAALAVEIFHNFSLIHDDIMDDAPLRRKQATVHSKWNTNVAILSGDVLLVRAYQEICKQQADVLPELMFIFNKTAVEVCEGQQLDMDFETKQDVSIADYLEMIRLKTSVLLGCALEMGAIVAGASKADSALLYTFGENIGVAFQIQDDILDLYADPEKFGKQVGGDVLANKKTLLLLKAYELADDSTRESLNILANESNADLKINSTRQIFDDLGIRNFARQLMEENYATAMTALHQIEVPAERKQGLKSLAEMLFNREV